MTIYAVSKGEGKNLHVKNTKFFLNKMDAEKYYESLSTMGDYQTVRTFDRATNKVLHESTAYMGKNVSEQDKYYFDLNLSSDFPDNSYYVKCEWERRLYNPYVITSLEVF